MLVSVRRLFKECLLAALLLTNGAVVSLAADDTFTPVIEITPDNPGIDNLLMLRLSIDVPSHFLVNFPRLGDKLGGLAVTGQRALETDTEVSQNREWVQQYRLEPETTGDLSIPPLIIVVQDPETLEAIEVRTEQTFVHIAPIVPPETDLRDIKDILPPVALPATAGLLSPLLLPGVVAIAGAILALWWLRRRAVPDMVEESTKLPHLVALEALEELQSASDADQAGTERFHIRLAAVLRRYLQDGFALPAPQKTTEELLHEVAQTESAIREQHALIVEPLDQCDLVKFARHRPSGRGPGMQSLQPHT